MTKEFNGVFTALVTPFTNDDEIDFTALGNLIDEQIEANCGVLVNGTTGESPTIEAEEFIAITKFVIEKAKGKVPVIVGTGSNNTKHTISKSQLAEKLGADGLLLVNPYYNKPRQEGLYQHFKAVAEAVKLPIMLYNIKGRTGINLETDTLMKLAEVDNIVAVKEASGDIEQIEEVCKRCPEDFAALLGDDSLAFDCMNEFGADGVVSVISNLYPKEMVKMYEDIKKDNISEASAINVSLKPIMIGLMSVGTNPEGIKTAMALKGKMNEKFRLPMCKLPEEKRQEVSKLIGVSL